MSACSASRWELTETYSPAAIESAPATRPATPAVTIEPLVAPEAATPSTRLPVDTIPSLAPSTAARSQFERRLRWVAGWLMGGRAARSCARLTELAQQLEHGSRRGRPGLRRDRRLDPPRRGIPERPD